MEYRFGDVLSFVIARRVYWAAVPTIFGVGIPFPGIISPRLLASDASDIDRAHFNSVVDLVCRAHHYFRVTPKTVDEVFHTRENRRWRVSGSALNFRSRKFHQPVKLRRR